MIAHWEALTFSGRAVSGAGSMRFMVGEPVCLASLRIGGFKIDANSITEAVSCGDLKYSVKYIGQGKLFGRRVIKFEKKRFDVNGAREIMSITGLAIVYVDDKHELWIGLGYRSDGKVVAYANKHGLGKFRLETIS